MEGGEAPPLQIFALNFNFVRGDRGISLMEMEQMQRACDRDKDKSMSKQDDTDVATREINSS